MLAVVWLVRANLIDDAAVEASSRISPLDLKSEKARNSADTRGGVGHSV